jgi:Glucosyl transferase GtrII
MTASFLSGLPGRVCSLRVIILPYVIVVLAAFGFAMFNLTLQGDDWISLHQPDFLYKDVLSAGRWMYWVFWSLADNNSFAPPLTIALLCTTYLIAAVILALCLGLEHRGSVLICACILVCFPVNAEQFSFKLNHLGLSFALLMSSAAGLVMAQGYELLEAHDWRMSLVFGLASAVMFTLSAATYQPVALFAVSFALARLLAFSRAPGDAGTLLLRVAQLAAFGSGVISVGLGLYWTSAHSASWITGVPLNRGNSYAITDNLVTNWKELWQQARIGFDVLYDLLLVPQFLFPLLLKLMLLASLAYLVFLFSRRNNKARGRIHPNSETAHAPITRVAVVAGTMMLLFITPLSIGMLSKFPIYRYNNLIGIAIPYAVVYGLLYDMAPSRAGRMMAAAVASLTIAVSAFEQNRAAVTNFLVNRRDFAIADRMLQRVSSNPAFAPYAADGHAVIVFYGTLEDRDLPRPFSVDHRGLSPAINRPKVDCGIFNCQLNRVGYLFRLMSESRMHYTVVLWPDLPSAISAEARRDVMDRIKAVHAWPAPDAVIFSEYNLIVIVLSGP